MKSKEFEEIKSKIFNIINHRLDLMEGDNSEDPVLTARALKLYSETLFMFENVLFVDEDE